MTISTVLENEIDKIHIARFTRLISTLRVLMSIEMVWILIPIYAAPLSNAACPEEGTILHERYEISVKSS